MQERGEATELILGNITVQYTSIFSINASIYAHILEVLFQIENL